MLRPILPALVALVGLTGARADGLVPAGSSAQGLCYASGGSGPRVPCVLQGQTWTPVLRPTDDGSDLGVAVGPNAATLKDRLRATAAGIDILAYVSRGDVQAGRDVAAPFRAAVAAAKAAGAKLLVPGVPGRCYTVGSTIDFSGVEIVGGGGCVQTSSAIDLFASSSAPGQIHDLIVFHKGSSGRIFNLTGDGNKIQNNKITADNTSAVGTLIEFTASNTHIRFNDITNYRSGSLTWRNIRNDPAKISINNQVVGNYFGGPGSGGWIGDDGSSKRPEGMLVAYNESVLTGGPFLTIRSILSARITGNMMDQGGAAGVLRFEPGGYNSDGIDGVLVGGNYISAPQENNLGPAIVSIAGAGGARASGVIVEGNQLAFGTLAADLGPGFGGQFANNYMHGQSSGSCIRLASASMLASLDLGTSRQCAGTPLVAIGNGAAGAVRSTQVGTYDTATGGGYLLIPHGLAAAPTKYRATASTAGSGGAIVQAVSVFVAAADATNVTLAVVPTGIATQGKIFITLDSEI